MNNANPLKDWLEKIGHRVTKRSPVFFRFLKVISGTAFILTGLTELIAPLRLIIPDRIENFLDGTVAVCTSIVWLLSSLTIKKEKNVTKE
jgi:hypothetical protein